MEGEEEGEEGGEAAGLVEGLGSGRGFPGRRWGRGCCIYIVALDIGTFGKRVSKVSVEHVQVLFGTVFVDILPF